VGNDQILYRRPLCFKEGEQLRRGEPSVIVIEIIVVDHPGVHPRSRSADSIFGTMIERTAVRIERVEHSQGIGHDRDLLCWFER